MVPIQIREMEEDHFDDDMFGDVTRKSGDATEDTLSAENEGPIFKKCIRRGDKICYSKLENINMLANVKRDGYTKKSSLDASDHADKVMSGESLYKAFTFQQGTNDEETEKCINFWKSVMEKNLAPIKCSIIENTNKNEEVPEVPEKESTTELNEEKLKNETTKIHDQYKTMWMTLLNELQEKRLHEIKLIGKSRCKICDSPLEEELHKVSKSELQKEIEALNTWVPKSKSQERIIYPNIRRQSRQMSTTIKKVENMKRASQMKPPEAQVVPEVPVAPAPPVRVPPPKPDTNTYQHIDVIEEKRKSGAYSEWRSNKVNFPCPCGYPDCDCNINPAIISVEIPSDSKFEATEDESITEEQNTLVSISIKDEKPTEGDIKPKEDVKRKGSTREEVLFRSSRASISSKDEKSTGDIRSKEDTKRKESLKEEKAFKSSRSSISSKDEKFTGGDIKSKEDMKRKGSTTEERALESTRTSISTKGEKIIGKDTKRRGSTREEEAFKSIRASVSNKNEKSTGGDLKRKESTREERAFKRKLSVLLNCMCSTSDCDCEALNVILGKIPLPPEDDVPVTPPPKIDKNKKSVGIVSSLEILEKKLKSKGKRLSTDDRKTQSEQFGDLHTDEHLPDENVLKTPEQEDDGMPQKECTCSSEDCDCRKAKEIAETKVLKKCDCAYPCDCEGQTINPLKADDFEDHVFESPNR